jgi:hypothetical protein
MPLFRVALFKRRYVSSKRPHSPKYNVLDAIRYKFFFILDSNSTTFRTN